MFKKGILRSTVCTQHHRFVYGYKEQKIYMVGRVREHKFGANLSQLNVDVNLHL